MSQTPYTLKEHPFEDKPNLVPPRISLIPEAQWMYLCKRYRLTQREYQIAQLICRGLSIDQAARSLDIKASTIKTHLRNLYRKTWVNSKISMLLRFVEDTRNQPSPQS
ncbi:MAG: helix-turn-helix transcriptional regulator [Sedimentisphaerales bacterium]|nr:helix-turn-helix transcriptional regulator [Sedimentisphaerales bacterium]